MPLFGAQTRRMLPRLAVCAAPLLQQMTAQCGGRSKHDQIEKYKVEAARAAQLKEATAWCDETGRKGYAAAHRKTDDGEWFWPLVTEGSVNRRLRGEVDNEHPFAAKSVLTPKEEADLVATCKELNEHGQGIGREQLGKMVYDSLLLRPTLNEGRDFTPLSANAEKILTAGRVGKDFFTRFFADHEDLSERKACSEEILRAKWMTPEVSQSHMEKLKATLERAGLLDEHGAIKDPRRVLNSDECPNPWRGTGDRGKTIAAVGAPCVKLVSAARENTTLDVLVGLDGFLYDAHLIFKGEYVQRQMIPEKGKIPNCKISATDKGYQTGSTLLETLKHWDKQLVARGVAKELSAFARANRVQLVEIGVGLTSLARKDLMPEMVHKLGTLMPHVQWTPALPKALPAPRAELQAAPAAAPAAAELLALPAPAGEPAAPTPVETAAATRSKRQRTTQNA